MKPFLPPHFFLALLLLLWPRSAAWAQGDPDNGGPTRDPVPTAVPIDGGASLLLATGLAYGVKRLRRTRAGGQGVRRR